MLQENHYYPFGMAMDGQWMANTGREDKYQYNGKELHEDFGLGWYAYGARFYDPAIGRFTGVDPIADRFPWVSTYNYAENEPIANIDLWGLQKYKPKIQPIKKPSDLVSTKMLNNAYEGLKTVTTELGTELGVMKDKVGNAFGKLLNNILPEQGTREAADYLDSDDVYKGSGGEILSNNSLNSANTLALPSAEKGSTFVLEQGEIEMITPGEAGGVLGDAAAKALQFARSMYHTGEALESTHKAIEARRDINNRAIKTKFDTTFTTEQDVKVTRFTPISKGIDDNQN